MKARNPSPSGSSRYVEAYIEGQGSAPDGTTTLFQVDCQGVSGKATPQAFIVSVPIKDAGWVKLTRVRLNERGQAPGRMILINDTEVPCTVVQTLGDSRKTFMRTA